jgi:hypothetical protein
VKTWNSVDLVGTNNADWDESITLGLPGATWDLTGATLQMQLRSPDSAPDYFANFTAELTIVSIPSKVIKLHVDDAVMTKIAPLEYSYDILVTTTAGTTIVGARGTATIYQGITIK